MAGEIDLERRVAAVRRFNRFYTSKIGVLHYLGSDFSLAEVRVLYELANRATAPTAAQLGKDLNLDAGYLSRLIRGFERRGLVARTRSASDGRRSHLALTTAGRAAFAPLGMRSHDEMAALLAPLSDPDQRRVIDAMETIEAVLGGGEGSPPFTLRPHRPGDMGWVVQRHGALYAQEYGWDERFEALVASIVAKFVERFDPARERCWIAEKDGEPVGSVFLVKRSKSVAQLRLLIVDPKARGLGIGARLVAECETFARESGYRTITLWTNSVLTSARRIYEAAGYRLVDSERHVSFGHELVGETWEKTL
jgi:DNA-binding MarR family transcriptional regulator/N-acetylglutamate synthase-like GNAT family acetyltransferase